MFGTGTPSDAMMKRVAKNRQLINQTADEKMVNANVPVLVKMLLNANTDLSNAGIGPRRNGGIPLYAGRWLDSNTGVMRIFPTANQKMLNPLSKNQKLAYL